ncbi:ABC transporter permease [Candidatus Pacearchaeota archaeon]|nr:ABC transporter permease [Candidatus Pacearchaeota archaeon]
MSMKKYIFKRAIRAVLTILFVIILNFILPRLMPGNIIMYFAMGPKLGPAARQKLIEKFGLDKPIWDQFILYLVNIFQGNFGVSFQYYPKPVWEFLMERAPWTLLIFGLSMIVAVTIGIFLGIASAWKHGTKLDVSIQIISLAIWSTPLFWMGMIFLIVFGVWIPWFPLRGSVTSGAVYQNVYDYIFDVLRHAVLPMLTLITGWFAEQALIMRSSMIETLHEDYILTAEAKGLKERRIKYRHAARNALLPVTTSIATSLGTVIGGSVLVENVFTYPGLGRLIFDAVMTRDYPVLQGAFFILAFFVTPANFIADIAYAYLDPRIKY